MDHLKVFAGLGTRFLKAPDMLQRQLMSIRAVLFDWDGVFNDGWKDTEGNSPFSETGSMGVNLLRFCLWQANQRNPVAGILTGQHNATAERFARREHFHAVYMGFNNKPEAFEAFLATHGLEAKQVAFFFDDVLDLPVARLCGLRVLIKQPASPLLENHISHKRDADLLTHHSGGHQGLREACELLIALMGRWDDTIEHRVRFSDHYQRYLIERNATETQVVARERS